MVLKVARAKAMASGTAPRSSRSRIMSAAQMATSGALAGVTGVEVDVAAGKVQVTGEPLPGDAALREAIAEAGYQLAG